MSRAIFLLLAAFALVLPTLQSAHAGGAAKPSITIENPGTQCVAPAEEMRRNHMELLKHQRNLTMRLGERGASGGKSASLNGCIECHASKRNGSVIGSGDNFCETCHAFVAVKLDCWDCHQPKAGYKAAATTPPPGGFKP